MTKQSFSKRRQLAGLPPAPLAPRRELAGAPPVRLKPECFACDNRPFDQVALSVHAAQSGASSLDFTGFLVGGKDSFICVAQFRLGKQVGFVAIGEDDAIDFAAQLVKAIEMRREERLAAVHEPEEEVPSEEVPVAEAPKPKPRRTKKPPVDVTPVAEE